jgi:predicted ATPase/Tfp pilus assembly protein PilF
VGRERELEALAQRCASSRLVTVLGPPGIGKSRLVVEATASLPGAAWVDLTEVRDLEGAVAAVGAALGVPLFGGGAEPVDQLGRALASRGPATLVLDNAELASDAVGELASRFIAVATELTIVVTSRVRLRVPGEALLDLGPLEMPDAAPGATSEAVELFLARTGAVRESFKPDDRELGVVAELVRELDGLPLAIELAASRARLMSVDELLAHVRGDAPSDAGRLGLLTAPGARGAALHEEIARSVRELDEAHRTALAQASVFRGGFTAAAAAALFRLPEGAGPVLDVLEGLADRSLLVVGARGGAPRFSLLLSIRDFAADDLERSGRGDDVRARHARYYADLGLGAADRLVDPDGTNARREIARERDNLSAAFEWTLSRATEPGRIADAVALAITLGAGLAHLGPLVFCHDVVSRAMEAGREQAPLVLLARALAAKVEIEINLERPAQSVVLARELLARAVAEKNEDAESRVASALGEALTAEGVFEEARELLERALVAERAAGRRGREARVLHALGVNRVEAGALPEGRLYFRAALRLLEQGDRVQLARSLNTAAVLAIEEGLIDEAQPLLMRGLEVARAAGDPRAEATLIGNLAACQAERGNLEEAERGYTAAIERHRAIGSRRNEGLNQSFVGQCALERGDWSTATERYEEALYLLQGMGWRRATVLGPYGAALAMLGERERARAVMEEARAELERYRHERILRALDAYEGFVDVAAARAARVRGDLASAQGHVAAARQRIAASMVDIAGGGSGPALAAQSSDVRVAVRALRRTLAEDGSAAEDVPAEAPRPKSLDVAHDASWFLPPDGERVSLERRKAMRLMLVKLVEERLTLPGSTVSTAALVAAGWPGEIVAADVGADRVYTALSTLRKLGLKSALQNRGDGYRIDPDLAVVRHS